MMGLPAPLAVVAHDAGAANLILAWLAAEGLGDVRAVMAGPAATLWRTRFGEAGLVADLDTALDGAGALLSGTGWASTLEHDARVAAQARDIPSVAVIDHWVNYRMRFSREGAECLPDRLWVADGYAVAEAHRALPEVPVEQKPNLYLAEQAAAAGVAPADGDVLFVAEPARSDWGKGEPGEFQALDWFWAHREAAGIGTDVSLRLRPHPSDPPDKYDGWIAAHPGSLLDDSADLAAAMQHACWVAGLQSFALVVALAAGRTAITALPPWAPPCPLPHDGLIDLPGQP